MLTLNDGRSELWQWDTGRTLAVDVDCSQVHFSNKVFGRSIDVDVIDGTAIIPDVLLQTDKDLNAWAFVGTAENGYTKISKTFKVNRRNKPADYVFTPPDQTTLAELSGRLDRIEESQGPDAIKNAVEDYLEQNPVEAPVDSVNGKTGAVQLTAADVGAIAYETDPTVPAWAKQPQKPTYTAGEVGADASGTAEAKVSAHNTGANSHSDIRLLIQGLTDRLNALADSDDTTLDQLSEVVAYIKSNRDLISSITTSKVSVADIVNNLTTNVTNKPLSAAQGVVIKTLIDALSNDKLDAAELTNAVNTALAQAKASGEFDGADGKSAYQYAKDGGYTGTEAEFAEKLAQEQLTGTTNDLTPTQVYQAVSAGIPVKVQYTDSTYGLLSFTSFNVAESLNVIVSQTIVYYNGVYILAELFGSKSNNSWGFKTTILAEKTDIPDIPAALPNPKALTFTGAVTGSYDGSEAVTVEIPSGGGGSGGGEAEFPNWRLIKTISFSADIAYVEFDTDDNGNTFSLKEIMLAGSVPAYSGYIYMKPKPTGYQNTIWPKAAKDLRWWAASVSGKLKTMLAVSNASAIWPVDKDPVCENDTISRLAIGASDGFTADGTMYVYGR